MKANDFSLSAVERAAIKQHADCLLREAKAYGVFPTPVKKLVQTANLRVQYMDELISPTHRMPEKVKRALGKLQGFLHRGDSSIYIDRSLLTTRRKFVSLHEVAHDFLPAHKMTFEILEDSAVELDEETRDTFEREANCFASDVLFQLDRFTMDAQEVTFGIGAPVKILSRKYGSGNYATIRRYTEECGRPAAVLVCDQPKEGVLEVRRFIPSGLFTQMIGTIDWPKSFARNSWFGQNRPLNKFMLPVSLSIQNDKGDRIDCLVEGYDSSRQVFYFMYPRDVVI